MYLIIITIFIVACVFVGIHEFQKGKNSRLLELVLFSVFIIIMAFRPTELPDTQYYVDYYLTPVTSNLQSSDIQEVFTSEKGYYLYNLIIGNIFGEDYRIYFAITAMINVLLIYFATKNILNNMLQEPNYKNTNNTSKHKNPTLLFAPAFGLYVSLYGFLYCGTVLRAGLAISIIYYAFSMLLKGKYFWSLLCIIISVLFHKTAIIGACVLLAIFIDIKYNKIIYFLYWIILAFLYVIRINTILAPLFAKYFAHTLLLSNIKQTYVLGRYLGYDIINNEYSLRTLFLLISVAVAIYYGNNRKINRIFLNICLLGLTFQILLGSINAFSRATDYLLIFSFMLMYVTLMNISNKDIRYAVYTCIIISNYIYYARLMGYFM